MVQRGSFRATGVHVSRRYWLTGAGLLLGVACGGAVDEEATNDAAVPVVVIAPRTPAPASTPLDQSAPPEREVDGLPSQVASLVSDPPQQVNAGQFDTLLGYYCINCHGTPPCSAACDGFFFDSWADLAAGGNHDPSDTQRLLERVITRLEDGSMPPVTSLISRPLPNSARALMIDFIQQALAGTP